MDIRNCHSLSEAEANAIYQQGREAVILFILKQSQHIEELEKEVSLLKSKDTDLPATPSGMIPIFKKPAIKRHFHQPGQKSGHKGSRRGPPEKIDHYQEHTLQVCPECQAELSQAVDQRLAQFSSRRPPDHGEPGLRHV